MTDKPFFGWVPNRAQSVSSGLIGSWILNEGAGTTTYDSSGLNNNGSFLAGSSGALSWTTGPAISNPGLTFDGYVDAGTGPATMLGATNTSVSLLVQFKLTSATQNGGIFGFPPLDGSGNNGTFGAFYFNGNVYVVVGDTHNAAVIALTDTTAYHTLIATYDGAHVDAYLDGVAATPYSYSTALNFTGRHLYTSVYAGKQYTFYGAINCTELWNRVLTSTEIASLTTNPTYFYIAPAKPNYGWVVDNSNSLTNGMVMSWLMNEGAGTTIHDTSSSGNNGTMSGTGLVWTTGAYGPALSFSNTSPNDVLQSALGLSAPITLFYSLTPTALPTNTQQDVWTSTAFGAYLTYYSSGVGVAGTWDPLGYQNAKPLGIGTQEFHTFTQDGTNQFVLYRNGAQLIPAHGTGNSGAWSNKTINIGFDFYNSFGMTMDFMFAWNRVLSAAEIASLNTNPFQMFKAPVKKPSYGTPVNKSLTISNGLVVSWLLNEGTGTTANDSYGSHPATFYGANPAPAWGTGFYGPALLTSNASISPSDRLYNTSLTGLAFPLTIMVSVTPSSVTGTQRFMSCSDNDTGVVYLSGTSIQTYNGAASMTSSVTASAGTHYVIIVVFTANGTNSSITVNGTTNVYNTAAPAALLSFPELGGNGNNSFHGTVDVGMVWNRVLTTTEIAALTVNPFAPYTNNPPVFFKI